MQTIKEALAKLDKSKFRSKFRLTMMERIYVKDKGMVTIRRHAVSLIASRLAPAHPVNDGSQTPYNGHPVFVAQHATACCCRKCLEKWYKVPQNIDLSESAQQKIVNLIMAWISREMERPEPKPRVKEKLDITKTAFYL
ncbi:MAG: DUF4186 domain-containing protein [Eubacteriales bacterium]|nr:DUF4186 domain-containing protein [Eubacteriales bacterium]